MKKKIVALIMVIPLLLVFMTFSLANVVVLTVPVPVTGVKLHMDEVEYLDVTERGSLKIEAEVLPDNAKEKGVTYEAKPVDGKSAADVKIDEAGYLTALGLGTVKVEVKTKDGNYTDGFLLVVTSRAAVGLRFAETRVVLKEGETRANAASVAPFGAVDKNVRYASGNPEIARVNAATGELIGISAGETTVAATLDRGIRAENGEWLPAGLTASVRVTVEEDADRTILVNGKSAQEVTEYADAAAEMIVSVKNSALNGAGGASNAEGEQAKLAAFYRYAFLTGGKYTAEILSETPEKTAFRLHVTFDADATQKSLTFGTDSVVKFKGLDGLDQLKLALRSTSAVVGERVRLSTDTLPETPQGLTLSYSVTDHSVAEIVTENGETYLIAKKEGVTELTVTGKVGDKIIEDRADISVIETPSSVNFRLNTTVWGIKERYAFGSHKISGASFAKDTLLLELLADRAVDLEKYEFTVSDTAIARISGNRLSVLKTGTVTVTAARIDAAALGAGDEFSASVTIDCVEGVNVFDYADLTTSTEAGKKTVLQADIAVGKDLTGLNATEKNAALSTELKKIKTTADWSYYKNAGLASTAPTVKVAVEFQDDLFGNGYTLNAHNITAATDSAGSPLQEGFQGPLDMVSATVGTLGAAVKAQDNIVFLVRNDGVNIDNVELKSRDLVPNKDGMVELNDLNYAGTTLEIMGDGVRLLNSRVRNGRTAVRIFGGSDADKKIEVGIESCILSYAREFVLKIGTNKTLSSTAEALQPNLEVNGKRYNARNDRNFEDEDFVNTFLKTDVTVKNTVFTTSGIFAIGIEAKFGGNAFREGGAGSYHFPRWKDASGTSYPARLRFEGDVGLYDWKNIDSIDSSTLIETTQDDPNLRFDIADILKKLKNKEPAKFGKILTDLEGAAYAHGGIAFYGGGKNYSTVDRGGLTAGSYLSGLEEISVGLDVVPDAKILIEAAGEEPFRFLMFTAESEMNVLKQRELLTSGKAYEAVKPAK